MCMAYEHLIVIFLLPPHASLSTMRSKLNFKLLLLIMLFFCVSLLFIIRLLFLVRGFSNLHISYISHLLMQAYIMYIIMYIIWSHRTIPRLDALFIHDDHDDNHGHLVVIFVHVVLCLPFFNMFKSMKSKLNFKLLLLIMFLYLCKLIAYHKVTLYRLR